MGKSTISFTNLKVGLTVFIGLVILFIFLFLVGTQQNYFTNTYNLKIFVNSTEGLTNGSMVAVGGIKVGNIIDMSFSKKNEENGIEITVKLKEEYKSRITEKSKATIKSIGLLGDKFIDVTMGQPGERPLEEGEFIPVNPSFALDKLTEDIQPTLKDFSQLISNLKNITDTVVSGKGSVGRLITNDYTINEMNNILRNLSLFTSAIVEQKGTIGKLTYNPVLFDNLTTLSSNLNEISEDVKSGKGSLGKLVTEDSVYNNVHKLSQQLNNLLAKTESDSTVVGGLLNDQKLYNELNGIITNLNNLLIEISNNPKKYLKISVF